MAELRLKLAAPKQTAEYAAEKFIPRPSLHAAKNSSLVQGTTLVGPKTTDK
jgi:hypothetical protein